ncbi:MAG: 3D domain-containing protein [Candidatus Nealsonbacteria bacterium]|nr:3D domain-containing protein [Candidatus Nealsonbacteria bacterium]
MKNQNKIKNVVFAALFLAGFLAFDANPAPSSALEAPEENSLLIAQNNSILPVSNPPLARVVKRVPVVITAYSSSPMETDEDPFTTAAGTRVRDGVVANNLLYFGTRIRFPELYGDKIFVVEDRMASYKGYYHFDIWFENRQEALNFGTKNTYIEILN